MKHLKIESMYAINNEIVYSKVHQYLWEKCTLQIYTFEASGGKIIYVAKLIMAA